MRDLSRLEIRIMMQLSLCSVTYPRRLYPLIFYRTLEPNKLEHWTGGLPGA